MITSRERVKKAIHFKSPEHVPHYLPDDEENDIIWIWIPGPEDIQPWREEDGLDTKINCWGVRWERPHGHAEYGEAKEWPIKDITKQSEYVFPDINNAKYFEIAAETITRNKSAVNPKYCLGVMPSPSLNEGVHNIMGLENMFLAYYEHPGELNALIDRLAESQRESIRKLAGCGCDGVMGYDDWGLQDRLMVSTDLIEEFFMPHYRKNWALAHDLGMEVWLHSCGHIVEVLPMFIEAGLDVIQQDQQENMGLEVLNKKFGGKLAFWCPVDVQKTMVEGTPADVNSYVKRMIDTLGSHNGGLISMAYTTPDAVGHTPENTAAMCKAFRQYGVYKND